MSRSGRIWFIIALAGIALLVVGVIVIGGIFQRALIPRPAPTARPPLTEQVVITTHDLPMGAVLKAEDLSQIEVPIDLVPRGALKDIEAVTGRITKIPLIAGEMIMPHHLADPTNLNHDLAFVIGEDQVLMAFPASDLMSGINLLQRGDLVDILVSISQEIPNQQVGLPGSSNEETQEETFTFDALQRVEISAFIVDILPARQTSTGSVVRPSTGSAESTPQPTPTPQPAQVEPKALLLALSPQDALVLKHLKDIGGVIDIVLRAPTSTQLYELDPVWSQYLRDRYQLEPAP